MTTWKMQNYGDKKELRGCHRLEWRKADYRGARKNLRGQLCCEFSYELWQRHLTVYGSQNSE